MLASIGFFLLLLTKSYAADSSSPFTSSHGLRTDEFTLSVDEGAPMDVWIKVPINSRHPVKLEFDFVDKPYPTRLGIEPVTLVGIFGTTTPKFPPKILYKLQEGIVQIGIGKYELKPYEVWKTIRLKNRFVAVQLESPSHPVKLKATYLCSDSKLVLVMPPMSAAFLEENPPKDPPPVGRGRQQDKRETKAFSFSDSNTSFD